MSLLQRLIRPNINKLAARGDVEGLLRVLAAPGRAETRARAAAALARAGDPRAFQALATALADEEGVVAEASEAGLRALGLAVAPSLAEVLDNAEVAVAARARSLLLTLGHRAVGPLVEMVRSGGDAARGRAVGLLGELWPSLDEREEEREDAFRALLAALGDGVATTRVWAATLLGEVGDPRAGRALAARLKDGDAAAREASVNALRRLGGAVVPHVVGALRDRNPNARLAAARLLAEVGHEGGDRATRCELREAAREAAQDRDRQVREAAAVILSRIPAEEDEVVEGGDATESP